MIDASQPPVAERRPMRPPLTGERMRTATGSTSVSGLLAHLGDVSRLREAKQAELEAVHAARWSR